ncbi:MAG: NifB/NifX family molybdenum-iron cluster-binding protein [Spirochaetota bacterium]
MKIAVPVADGKLNTHFGHCALIALIDTDQAANKIAARTDIVPPPHEPGLLPRWLGEKGVDMIIAGGMGQKAQQLFSERGIQVIVGAPCDTPENLVNSFLSGSLVSGVNVCDH